MNIFDVKREKQKNVCVVRVQTEAFKRGDTYFYGKSVRVLKKLTSYDLIHEEVGNIGIQEALENILNLGEVQNGIYELVIGHRSYDIETGYLDGWDFRLILHAGD